MAKFGDAAVLATRFYRSGATKSPERAWESAVREVFPDSKSCQEKSCPRGAYLGLCEEGLVHGVPSGSYTRSKLNKSYAVSAVSLLRARPRLAENADTLWQLAVGESRKVHNGQMDVVLALWDDGYIKSSSA